MPTATYIKFNTAIENMLESGNLETETYVLKLATAINTSAGSITETTNGVMVGTKGEKRFEIVFENDEDALAFILRWA